MKSILFYPTFLLLLISVSAWHCNSEKNGRPLPTTIKYGEEGEGRDLREAWLESMHRAAADVDWRQIEYQNQIKRQLERADQIRSREGCGVEALANGKVLGRWIEQGSVNQAGSVFDTEYDPIRDEIWLISAGGTLWRSPRDGSNWQVVHQGLRFSTGLLKFIPRPQGRRLLAFVERIPHYSDDDGLTWQAANGINYTTRDGNFYKPTVLQNAIYVLAKATYSARIILYKSTDQGETYQPIHDFLTSESNRITLCNPHHSNELLLLEKASAGDAKIYRVEPETNELTWLNEGGLSTLKDADANLAGWSGNGKTILYTYVQTREATTVQVSENYGMSWQTKGFLDAVPWEVGLYVLPSDPSTLFMGEVNCYRSQNGGGNWSKVNDWSEYYGNIAGKLHADIMHLAEFNDAEGYPFLLVSHHGGLTISEDYLDSQHNISLSGLNVSQYYSVRTDPNNPNYVYAGSQDQGFQRANNVNETGNATFEQVISGDYGHIVFSNNGQSLWTVYPGGWVTYYPNAQQQGHTADFEVKSDNESVWLPPLVAGPNAAEDVIYMAGGNKNGGGGSYIIRLEAKFGGISSTQQSFDFKDHSGGGELSALAISSLNANSWFSATTNGRFFRSENAGQTWRQTLNFIPAGHYLYGQAIYPSKIEETTVYLGGSGYSNPPVYKSTDGGKSFVSMSEGLPNTLVFGIAANADESLLFAATEAGPYVFVKADNRWYDLSGQCAPAQTYWSVEFVAAQNLVRFGTYGRGIWDFKLEETTATDDPIAAAEIVNIFPNPSKGIVHVDITKMGESQAQLFVWDAHGKLVQQMLAHSNNRTTLNLSSLAKGTYFIQIKGKEQSVAKKIILH